MSEPLIIKEFNNAVAQSPHEGFGLMRCVDISQFPGAVKANPVATSLVVTPLSDTFTADASTDICTLSTATCPITGTAILVSNSGGGLPAGLSANTVYFIIKISSTTFKLATNITNADAGTAINITSAGTGTQSIVTVNIGTVNHIVYNTRSGVRFFLDSKGRVWYTSGTTIRLLWNSGLDINGQTGLSNANGQGMVLWQLNESGSTHYLLVFRNQKIDIINVYGSSNLGTPSWTNGWDFGGTSSDTTLNSAAGYTGSHHAIVGQDDIVYFCDGRYVGSIRVTSGSTFDPATAATYTGNDQALDLPTSEVAEWLEEKDSNLLIAGSSFNKIYPWDRLSSSYNLPINTPEVSVKRIKNMGGMIYALVGTSGNIYVTNGNVTQFLTKLPWQMTNNSGSLATNTITWGGISATKDALLVGVLTVGTTNSGVYKVWPDGRLVLDQVPSTGDAKVTAIDAQDDLYYFGYTNGLDYQDTARYTNFQGVVQSPFYRVATKTEKTKYSTCEIVLAKPASSGHVRLSYRTNTSGSFTTLDTFTCDGTNTTFENGEIGLIDIENIQVQAEIDGDVELVEIKFLP